MKIQKAYQIFFWSVMTPAYLVFVGPYISLCFAGANNWVIQEYQQKVVFYGFYELARPEPADSYFHIAIICSLIMFCALFIEVVIYSANLGKRHS